MDARELTLTPALAAQWKTTNKSNRPMSMETVRRYAEAIRRGDWQHNGESIKFSAAGRLLDGQHRIEAVLQAGIPIKVLVAFGLPDACFATIDTGRRRTGGDVLAIRGYKNYNALSAAIAAVWRYDQGTMGSDKGHRPSHLESEKFLEQHPNLPACVNHVCSKTVWRRGGYMSVSLLSALYYLFSRKDAALADQFMEQLHGGEGLTANDSIYWLRKRIMDNWRERLVLPQNLLAALAIKAWNATREGRQVRSLRWATEEAFPTVV